MLVLRRMKTRSVILQNNLLLGLQKSQNFIGQLVKFKKHIKRTNFKLCLAAGKFVEICHNGEECFTVQEFTSQLLTRIKDDNFLVSSLQYQESRIGEIQSYIIMHIIGQMIN